MFDELNEQRWQNQDKEGRMTRIIQFGEVSEVDPVKHRVKVTLPGQDGITSAWLQVGTRRAKGVSQTHTYETGEQVLCAFQPMGDGSTGAVICALHNDEDLPWSDSADIEGVRYADGTTFSYDMASKSFELSLTDGKVSVTATPDGWLFTGKVTFQDAVTNKDAVTCEKTLEAEGNISTKAELSDSKGTVSNIRETYNDHDHEETDSTTKKPNQQM